MMTSTETVANLSCRVLRTLPELQEIASEWRDLFHRSRATAFQSPDWVLPWIEVFVPEKMVAIAVRSGSRSLAWRRC